MLSTTCSSARRQVGIHETVARAQPTTRTTSTTSTTWHVSPAPRCVTARPSWCAAWACEVVAVGAV